jgi:hypothetical protein
LGSIQSVCLILPTLLLALIYYRLMSPEAFNEFQNAEFSSSQSHAWSRLGSPEWHPIDQFFECKPYNPAVAEALDAYLSLSRSVSERDRTSHIWYHKMLRRVKRRMANGSIASRLYRNRETNQEVPGNERVELRTPYSPTPSSESLPLEEGN